MQGYCILLWANAKTNTGLSGPNMFQGFELFYRAPRLSSKFLAHLIKSLAYLNNHLSAAAGNQQFMHTV